jgi:glycosyltransferase involved in cell wall biosynthesis
MRTYLVETIFPDYRMPLFCALKEKYRRNITLACGSTSFSKTLKTAPGANEIASIVENQFFLKRRLLWQDGVISEAVEADQAILEFCLRAISTWRVIRLRRQLGKRTILWGHARGRRRSFEPIRRWMLRNSDEFIAYTHSEQRELVAEFPQLRVHVAPNACLWERDCSPAPPSPEQRDIIYVGRLVPEKKPLLLAEAYAKGRVKNLIPRDARLIVVGEGPEREPMEMVLRRSHLEGTALFTGHISNTDALRRQYATALCSVSPGYVGLSVTQALAFGVPMIIADNEPHSPEIEACKKGENCSFFAANDADALAESFGEYFRNREKWRAARISISDGVKRSYSFDAMLRTFIEVIGAKETSDVP